MRIIGKPTILRAPLVSLRRFLKTAAAAGTVAVACPAISRAGDRPQVSHGVQSGDVSTNSGVVWARADRPARMQVELA
ncbi:MAG: PhoD-like phosphatase N-terminal domain-containing protein, partial [Xanthobacteraceae bacterium]